MENFGCCSHYLKCSDEGNCLFSGNVDYEGCSYNKNLILGNNFYSVNFTPAIPKIQNEVTKIEPLVTKIENEVTKIEPLVTKIENEVTKIELPEQIFLSCYERYFKIGHFSRNGWTYPLKQEEKELLLDRLAFLNVPFETNENETKCIIDGDDIEPANCKVIFSFSEEGQKFSIANYNSFLIRKRYADGITKALQNKGITAKIELIGSYSKIIDYSRQKPISTVVSKEIKNSEVSERVQASKEIVKETYKQISLFEYVS